LQVYVIQGRYRGRIVALGFALMKRRRRANYRDMFAALAMKCLAVTGRNLAPTTIVTDFEVTIIPYI
jgi:hypothetical protein